MEESGSVSEVGMLEASERTKKPPLPSPQQASPESDIMDLYSWLAAKQQAPCDQPTIVIYLAK